MKRIAIERSGHNRQVVASVFPRSLHSLSVIQDTYICMHVDKRRTHICMHIQACMSLHENII
jgi:hypothetical protein